MKKLSRFTLACIAGFAVAPSVWGQAPAFEPRLAAAAAQEEQQIAARATKPLAPPAREDMRDMPAPLVRYFRYTMGQRPPQTIAPLVRLVLKGTVRIPQAASADGVTRATPWLEHNGTEILSLSADNAAFLWKSVWSRPDGRTVQIRDKYDQGQSHILAKVDGIEPLIEEAGDANDRADFLIRLFAESTQMPPYLLPNRYLRWEAVDNQHARAVLTDGTVRAEMVCRFAETGALERCESQQRRLRVSGPQGGYAVPAGWSVTRGDYREMSGMKVPTSATVTWWFKGQPWEQVTLSLQSLELGDAK
jgi:hypothetical protein